MQYIITSSLNFFFCCWAVVSLSPIVSKCFFVIKRQSKDLKDGKGRVFNDVRKRKHSREEGKPVKRRKNRDFPFPQFPQRTSMFGFDIPFSLSYAPR